MNAQVTVNSPDFFAVITMMVVLSWAMKKHGTWKKPLEGIGDYFGWGMACFLMYAIGKVIFLLPIMKLQGIPITFPLVVPAQLHYASALLSLVFWFCMIYWRVPGRILGRDVGQKQKR